MRLKLPLLAALVLVGCPAPVTPSPNPFPVPNTDECGAMCSVLHSLGCVEGKDVYDSDVAGDAGVPNETCTQDCQKQQGNGVFYNPICVKHITACLQIETVRKQRCTE